MNAPSASLPTLGFIGLGHMGGPMAARLAQAGYPLVVFDIAADAVQTLVSRGARAAASARERKYEGVSSSRVAGGGGGLAWPWAKRGVPVACCSFSQLPPPP
jgi:UDP-N-acetyl-D-mannosaminuronate dehydrogenase